MFFQSKKCCTLFIATFLLLMIPSVSDAATTSSATSEIGADSAAFRRRSSRSLGANEQPNVTIQLPAEAGPVPADVALKEFFVKQIKLEGVNEISLAELQPILAKFENQNLNLAKLNAIAQNITEYYRLKGFITSRAYVPPQEIDQETVVIKIVEGRLGKIQVSGNKRVKPDWLLRSMKMKFGEVILYSKLLQDLNRLNRNPDRRVRAALAPGETPETSDILLNVEEQTPYHFVYTLDNHGTRLSGRLRHGIQFHHSNLFGRDDALYNTLIISNGGDFLGEAMNYVVPVSPTGGKFILSYAYSGVELGKEFRSLDVEGGANIGGIGYVHPLVDQANWSLDLASGLDLKEIWSTVGGVDNSKDHLSVFHVGPNLLVRDATGTTTLSNDFIFGIPDFLGSDDEEFFVDNLNLQRIQKFFWDSLIVGRFEAQITEQDLVSAQQFRVGGFDTVRGYAEGDALGDFGFLQSTEWRIPPYFVPRDWTIPWTKASFWEAIQLLAFVDIAGVNLHDPAAGQESYKNLVGAGLGMRINLTKVLSAQIDCGWPIGDRPEEDERGARLHFGLSLAF